MGEHVYSGTRRSDGQKRMGSKFRRFPQFSRFRVRDVVGVWVRAGIWVNIKVRSISGNF